MQSNLDYALKSLQSELTKIEPVPVQISKALQRGKSHGLHLDLSQPGQHNERPFDWQLFGKSMVQKVFGVKR